MMKRNSIGSSNPHLIGNIQADKPKKSDLTFFGKEKIFGLRPTDMARIKAGQIINEMDPITNGQLGFSTRTLVQANLPHSNPGKDARIWVRHNGDFSLIIQSDITIAPRSGKEKVIGIPYGTIPRLVLFYLCSEAIRTKSREISLGNNLTGFLKELGLQRSGGVKGDITRFKNQIERLVTAKIKFEYEANSNKAGFNASIAKRYFFFWDQKNPDQPTLFQSRIVLDGDFFQEIVSSPVPIHLGAVAALKSSSFGLDLYTWLTYRVIRLEKPVTITWKALEQQIGADYNRTKNFAQRAIKVLSEVKAVWNSLNYDVVRGGFLLKPSKPSIPRKTNPN